MGARTAISVVYEHGERRGWGEDTEAGLLARFIDEKGLTEELDAFLTKIGEDEDEMFGRDEDEDE